MCARSLLALLPLVASSKAPAPAPQAYPMVPAGEKTPHDLALARSA